ncbi:AAA family ATPase [Ornithinimicrobium murale]|uniref:AAA family ATPase n=1 Tax=Ornithinimicrobium murale TaxID=1050153 RepID=UPI000E0D6FDE|nr:AAA family ATPase [Ornithinimicrobium murale]
MSDWARFWAVDLHVHTPGSEDVNPDDFGSAHDIVSAAVAAGLDAIAVTDHNTSAWCQQMAEAARDASLIVLPGVEISTTEGHLLAIWEERTDPTIIDEVLVRLGIGRVDRGKLDIAAEVGFAEAAEEVERAGGLAIAAHIEKEKGLLRLAVKAHLKKTLLNTAIHAAEVVHLDSTDQVKGVLGNERDLAFVRSSDAWDATRNRHSIDGIGVRRTWVKASRPDLIGLRHALSDPGLRISLEEPPAESTYWHIEGVEILGGFLGGERISFSPDLNCLLGGTGTGKSLILEAIRFALDQQVDAEAFPAIRQEIDSRMTKALMNGSTVVINAISGGRRYKIERTLRLGDTVAAQVYQQTGSDWAEIDAQPPLLFPLAAFSQGEILEYSREPVGRMTLVDSAIDLTAVNSQIETATDSLRENARALLGARERVHALGVEAEAEPHLTEQVRQLTDLFRTDAVKEQSDWTVEHTTLARISEKLGGLHAPDLTPPGPDIEASVSTNEDLFTDVAAALKHLKTRLDAAHMEICAALEEASTRVSAARSDWDGRFTAFKSRLDEELERVAPGSSLGSLRASLEHLQLSLNRAQAAQSELAEDARPILERLQVEREELLGNLQAARQERRRLRRDRVSELNAKAAGFVKLDVPVSGDPTEFRRALDRIKVGSRVREEILNQLALRTHPVRFVRSMWRQAIDDLVNVEAGIDLGNIAKLYANVDEKDLWEELLEMQCIDRPDVLTVKFRRPDDQAYTPIEELAHGQRCTAVLVTLLADGDTPVLVDQPEDALHAPWIEEYLVDRLRSLRGTRQYIFATRSPGIVVSGDAEQIITMRATAGHGEVEARGSLERHELNRLTLNHLEGGPIPFERRASKLSVSVRHP